MFDTNSDPPAAEHRRGQLATVLKFVEGNARSTFHGLGSLVAKKREAKPSAQEILQRNWEEWG